MKVKPLSDNVLIKPIEIEARSSGGIIIPDTAKEKPMYGEVIAIGPGKFNEKGKRIVMNLKVGDRVLFSKYAGIDFKYDDEDHLIIKESESLAIIEN